MDLDRRTLLDRFSRTYSDHTYEFTTTVAHQGVVIALAMDDARHIRYAVLDLEPREAGGPTDESFDADGWPVEPTELRFPTEIAQVGFGVTGSHAIPVFRAGSRTPEPPGTQLSLPGSTDRSFRPDHFLSTTARLTARAPFHVVSDGSHVLVFRQAARSSTSETGGAIGDRVDEAARDMVYVDSGGRVLTARDDGQIGYVDAAGEWVDATNEPRVPIVDATLLVDRFVLVGHALQPTAEVRFQRSRSKTRPQSHTDSLGAKDLDGRLFHEATQELSFVRNLTQGRFSVLLVPTTVAGAERWQVFAHNAATGRLDLYSIERSSDGLFNTRGSQVYTCVAHPRVFSLRPGTCSEPTDTGETCGAALTPRIDSAGHAESALRFTASGSWVELQAPPAAGPQPTRRDGEFTIEAWVRPEPDGADLQLLAGCWGPTGRPEGSLAVPGGTGTSAADAGVWLWIVDRQKLRIGFGDGTRWNQFTTSDVLEPGAWNHLAVSFATSAGAPRLSFYVDGAQRAETTSGHVDEAEASQPHELTTGPSAEHLITSISSPRWPLIGTVDEVRLWHRARSADELRSDMCYRLTGLEPGLAAYWRFDEARSERVYDKTDHDVNGSIHDATWVRSDAPVGPHPGLARDSVVLAERDPGGVRSLDSAPTATLYFQPTPGTGGYGGTDKPMRRSGRVMVAVSTVRGGGDPDPLIAVLDMGVSVSGRLNQLPDSIELERIDHDDRLALHPVAIDGDGLTTTGALLGFAPGASDPFVFDGGAGRLGLYVRDHDDALAVAYFDPLTQPAQVGLEDERGAEAVRCVATPGTEPDRLSIDVGGSGAGAGRCTVRISSLGVVERWADVPRAGDAFAQVINGDAGAEYDYARSVSIKALADDPSSPTVLVPPGAHPNGSLLVRAAPAPRPAHRPTSPAVVPQQQHADGGQRRPGWARASTDRALRVTAGCVATAAARTPTDQFDAADDLTIEAWVQPEHGMAPNGSIVTHRSPRSSYELKLEARRDLLVAPHGRTVFWFYPPEKKGFKPSHIQIAPDHLDFSGKITLEAWVSVLSSMSIVNKRHPANPRTATMNIVAHGCRPIETPGTSTDGEVFLRINKGQYEIGSCDADGRTQLAAFPIPAADFHGHRIAQKVGPFAMRVDFGNWVHLAGVYDGEWWRLYRNGVEVGSAPSETGAVTAPGLHWNIGASTNPKDPRYFSGMMDDVRIWSCARSADEIREHLGEHLTSPATEPHLVGNWCGVDRAPGDRSRSESTSRTLGPVQYLNVELPPLYYAPEGVWPTVEVNGIRARATKPIDGWSHLAATYAQSFAMQFEGDHLLDCGDDAGHDIAGDLTVEVFGQVDDLGAGNGLVAKGTPATGTDDRIPYALALDHRGRLRFAFQDVDGRTQTYLSTGTVRAGTPFRVAASRKRKSFMVKDTCTVEWHEIVLRVENLGDEHPHETTHLFTPTGIRIRDGVPEGPATTAPGLVTPPEIGRGSPTLAIGRSYRDLDRAATSEHLHGCISEVRLWSTARDAIADELTGDEPGLVSWWRFDERAGPLVADHAGHADATFVGPARWVHDPDPRGSTLRISVDGTRPSTRTTLADERSEGSDDALTLFERSADGDGFLGNVDELRIWRVVRTPKQVQDDMFRRVLGAEPERLIAYYLFDLDIAAGSESGIVSLHDRSGSANHLEISGGEQIASDAPIGDDAPQIRNALAEVPRSDPVGIRGRPAVAEYGRMQVNAAGRLDGVLKRCYAIVLADGSWELITGFKVGDLATEWVSQVQFNPQLKGYIEGAPPVPRENLGQRAVPGIGDIDDYNEASWVRLEQADQSRHTFSVNVDRGFDQQWDLALGAVFRTDASAGFGYVQKVFEADSFIGMHTKFDNTYSWLNESITGAGQTTRRTTSLELRGRMSPTGFLPDNVGLALVESETADLYAMRLRSNDTLVGYHLRPNPDIPADWNIVHFPLDPRYTKQGTLDGFVGLEPDPDYPNAGEGREEASYYKPKEAYQLKDRIQREEAQLSQRFEATDLSPGPHAAKLPRLEKRNIVNTYVWTADGGLFAEAQETMDCRTDVTGGEYRFLGMAGAKTEMLFAATAGTKFSLDAMFGGHLNRVETKTAEATKSFSLEVSVDKVERDIYRRDAEGHVLEQREPGRIDAYRFMTFYLEPSADNFDEFFGRVVDPIWLEQHPAAAPLRQARQEASKPPCWRVMHRVTFRSRVLPPAELAAPGSLERKLPELDIDSNYELIRQLEPYLDTATWQSTKSLQQGVESALVIVGLDELLGDSPEITSFMEQYLAARATRHPLTE